MHMIRVCSIEFLSEIFSYVYIIFILSSILYSLFKDIFWMQNLFFFFNQYYEHL
jgi:hypothetical protein